MTTVDRARQLLATATEVPEMTMDHDHDDVMANHGPVNGAHTHAHAAYGSQGGDVTHEHMHSHNGDAHHGHDHGMRLPAVPVEGPLGAAGFVRTGTEAPGPVYESLTAAMTVLGSPWGVEQVPGDDDHPESWTLYDKEGAPAGSFGTYQEAVAKIGQTMQQGGVLPELWRSDMAFENRSTGDGRFIESGAIEFRDCPMPLMLQTETEIGHFGAVLAGAITSVGMIGEVAVGAGTFDDNDAGRQFRDIISARGRFGVSIDVAEAEGEMICTDVDEDGYCIDGEMRFSLIRVMGLTGTPFPAFEDAFIELNQQTVNAAGEPCVDCEQQATGGVIRIDLNAPGAQSSTVSEAIRTTFKATNGAWVASGVSNNMSTSAAPLAAAAAPLRPPAEWFEDPHLTKPTPLTVTPEGRVYGHIAAWESCHTGFANKCVRPPHSRSGYAFFTTGALVTKEGTTVRVGQLTMGCGHASDSPSLGAKLAKAHYDGGPGAVQMADVTAGEDKHGIWCAGALRPGVTDEQIREFCAQGLSGDWREVVPGEGLELLAVLSVPVQGFPIAASGAPMMPKMGWSDGHVTALVAAGIVPRPLPWEEAVHSLRAEVAALRERLDRAERVTSAVRGQAAEHLIASLNGDALTPVNT